MLTSRRNEKDKTSLDLRDHPRYEVNLAVAYSGDQVVGRGVVVNISRGGCGIKADATIPIGTFLELSVDLPPPRSPLHIDLAIVRWSLGKNFGLDFLQVHPDHETQLRRFLKSL
ncbi:MAG: PilZ domain-containing protein [Nitrospirota bacterium]